MNKKLYLLTTTIIGILICGCGNEEGDSHGRNTPSGEEASRVGLRTAIPIGEYRILHQTYSDNTVNVNRGENSQPMHSKVHFHIEFLASVQARDDDPGKTITLRPEYIDQKIEGPISIDIDTASENDDAMHKAYRELLGVPIRVQLDENDMIQDISGFDTFWSKLPQPVSTKQKLMFQHLRKSAGPACINYLFNYQSIPIPDAPVAPSAAWKAKLALPLDLIPDGKYEAKCVFEKLEDTNDGSQVATLSTTGVFGVDEPEEISLPDAGNASMLLKNMKIDLKTQTQIILDSGAVPNRQLDYSGSFTLAPERSPNQDMTSKVAGKNVTRIKRLRK